MQTCGPVLSLIGVHAWGCTGHIVGNKGPVLGVVCTGWRWVKGRIIHNPVLLHVGWEGPPQAQSLLGIPWGGSPVLEYQKSPSRSQKALGICPVTGGSKAWIWGVPGC